MTNIGDRPIQVGSHYPFAETNKCLKFDRETLLRYRLNIPTGTAVRFEPGESKDITVVEMARTLEVFGRNTLINSVPSEDLKDEISQRMRQQNYLSSRSLPSVLFVIGLIYYYINNFVKNRCS